MFDAATGRILDVSRQDALEQVSPGSVTLMRNLEHVSKGPTGSKFATIPNNTLRQTQPVQPASIWAFPLAMPDMKPVLFVHLERIQQLHPKITPGKAQDVMHQGDGVHEVLHHRCKIIVELRCTFRTGDKPAKLRVESRSGVILKTRQGLTEVQNLEPFEFPFGLFQKQDGENCSFYPHELVFSIAPEDPRNTAEWNSMFGTDKEDSPSSVNPIVVTKRSILPDSKSSKALIVLATSSQRESRNLNAGLLIHLKWMKAKTSQLVAHNIFLQRIHRAPNGSNDALVNRPIERVSYVWDIGDVTREWFVQQDLSCPLCAAGRHQNVETLRFHLQNAHSEFRFNVERSSQSYNFIDAIIKIHDRASPSAKQRLEKRKHELYHPDIGTPNASIENEQKNKRIRKDTLEQHPTISSKAHQRDRRILDLRTEIQGSPKRMTNGVQHTDSHARGGRSYRLAGVNKHASSTEFYDGGDNDDVHEDDDVERDLREVDHRVSFQPFGKYRSTRNNEPRNSKTVQSQQKNLDTRINDSRQRLKIDKVVTHHKANYSPLVSVNGAQEDSWSESSSSQGPLREVLAHSETRIPTGDDEPVDLVMRSKGYTSISHLKHKVPAAPEGVNFFRTISKRPLAEGEYLSESDDDRDETWLFSKHAETIQNLGNLSTQERDFIKLYDSHFQAEQITGNKFFAKAFRKFVKNNQSVLVEDPMFSETCKKAASLCATNVLDVSWAKRTIDILIQARRASISKDQPHSS